MSEKGSPKVFESVSINDPTFNEVIRQLYKNAGKHLKDKDVVAAIAKEVWEKGAVLMDEMTYSTTRKWLDMLYYFQERGLPTRPSDSVTERSIGFEVYLEGQWRRYSIYLTQVKETARGDCTENERQLICTEEGRKMLCENVQFQASFGSVGDLYSTVSDER